MSPPPIGHSSDVLRVLRRRRLQGQIPSIGTAEYGMSRHPSHHRLRIVACPEPGCTAPAEVIDHHIAISTSGPVPMTRTRCIGKHIRDWVDVAA